MTDVEVVGSAVGDHPAGPPDPGGGGDAGSDAPGSTGGVVDSPGEVVGPSGADQPPQAPTNPALPPDGAVLVRDAVASPPDPDPDPEPARRTAPRGPRRARVHAVKILYQAEQRGMTPEEALERLEGDPRGLWLLDDRDDTDTSGSTAGGAAVGGARRRRRRDEAGSPLDDFARRLVLGVHGHRAQIDAHISRHARGWAIHRMPVIDRSLLRLATFELLDGQLPAAMVINEAVDLAKSMSTDDSGRFVNGVLDAIHRELDQERGSALGSVGQDPSDGPPESSDGPPESSDGPPEAPDEPPTPT